MKILCVMRIPPALNGHGGSQRAWFLLHALRQLAPIHFVLVSRKFDRDAATVPLDPIRPLVESVTHIDIPEWNFEPLPHLGPMHRDWRQVWKLRSAEAPKLTYESLRKVAEQFPIRSADMLFAGRLPTAVILQSMMERGLLAADFRFADFDDLMSRYVERRLQAEAAFAGRQGRAILRYDARYIRRAEARIASAWDGVSVCTDADVDDIRDLAPQSRPSKIPNVVSRDFLPARLADDAVQILFVGNLGSLPNVDGLRRFSRDAWPSIRAALPHASLLVVGLDPSDEVRDIVAEHGFELHANVPDLHRFYQRSDIVISPILIGSGTRIKILEAMAYGRPVVSTFVGAEGLGLENGREAMLVEEVAGFVGPVIALARDPDARQHLADRARAYQQREYSPATMDEAIRVAMQPGTDRRQIRPAILARAQ